MLRNVSDCAFVCFVFWQKNVLLLRVVPQGGSGRPSPNGYTLLSTLILDLAAGLDRGKAKAGEPYALN